MINNDSVVMFLENKCVLGAEGWGVNKIFIFDNSGVRFELPIPIVAQKTTNKSITYIVKSIEYKNVVLKEMFNKLISSTQYIPREKTLYCYCNDIVKDNREIKRFFKNNSRNFISFSFPHSLDWRDGVRFKSKIIIPFTHYKEIKTREEEIEEAKYLIDKCKQLAEENKANMQTKPIDYFTNMINNKYIEIKIKE